MGEIVWKHIPSEHQTIQRQAKLRGVPLDVSAHEGVPSKRIGGVNLQQELVGVAEIEELRGNGKGKEAAGGKSVLCEASGDHLGMDLKEFLWFSASLK